MAINPINDYSNLFSSLSSSSSTSNSFSLSDYASIKNGSYGKLLKAYYSKDKESTSTSTASTVTDTEKATLSSIKDSTDGLKEASDNLLSGKVLDSGDTAKIYDAVKKFADEYNSLLDDATNADTKSVLRMTTSMIKNTKANEDLLSKVGVTIGADNKLTVDEAKLKAANLVSLKSLFTGNGSLASSLSAKASQIYYAADRAINAGNTYTQGATYSKDSYIGKMFDGYL